VLRNIHKTGKTLITLWHIHTTSVAVETQQFRVHFLVTSRWLIKLHTLTTINHTCLQILYLISLLTHNVN